MTSQLHLARQGLNQRCIAGTTASVIVLPGCHYAHHSASRAVPKAIQVNRLTLRVEGQFRSPRSFVQQRAGACSAIRCGSSLSAVRTRSGSLHSAAKTDRARRQSNNALSPTAQTLARLGSRAVGAAAG